MEKFTKILDDKRKYAEDWKKRTGGKILGYFDPYMPEELVYAAGVLPIRILAEQGEDDVTDKQMYGNCYCTRSMLRQFINGEYDYVDGLVHVETCQWLWNAFQTIVNNQPEMFNHYFFMPDYTDGKTSKDVELSEMHVLKTRLEEWTGNTITDESIDNAIEIYNTNRSLLRQLYELRRADNIVITGSETMKIMLAGQIMDKAEMNEMLKDFLVEVEEREPLADGLRIMLIGSETYDAKLEEAIEALGAHVVIDEFDNGSSYIWNQVIPQKDRLLALSLRYLGRPHSALKDNVWRRRLEHIFELSEDYQVDGVIISKQIYCHPHGTDMYAVWKLLRERNIPYHTLERDLTLPKTETKIRVEAFLNFISPGVTRMSGWSEKENEVMN